MKPFSISNACEWTGGELVRGNGERFINRVSTDTRSIQPGDLFVALRGERFNGHDYAVSAQEQGAIAMLCDTTFAVETAPESLSLIRVPDTLKALQQMAAAYRQTLSLRVVGITGSNGKTSTKEMIAAALSTQFRVQKTDGNLNNHIGVPLTILSLEESTEIAVIEMGMNHRGEIRPLAEMSAPDIGVITGIGWVHVEAFDSRDGIAEEKGALIRALKGDGVAIVNGDDSFLQRTETWTSGKILRVGFNAENQISLDRVSADEKGTRFKVTADGFEVEAMIPLFGAHMAANAGLAMAVALECGIQLGQAIKGLETLELPGGRLKLHRHQKGWLLDDTYNASPDSMVAGMQSLSLIPGSGKKVALLGAMAELGDYSEPLHEWVGEQAVANELALLGVMGPHAEAYLTGARKAGMSSNAMACVESHQALLDFYQAQAKDDDVVLVKGSRSMAMEKVVEMLQEVEN